MSIFEKFFDIQKKYQVRLHEGENFKQALYNDRMTDSNDCIIDKIELVIKHYPDHKDILLSTYESDIDFYFLQSFHEKLKNLKQLVYFLLLLEENKTILLQG